MDILQTPPQSATKRVVAAFDFDGTLSRGVSGIRFYGHLLGPFRSVWMAVRHSIDAFCFTFRLGHEASMDRCNRHVFRGRRAEDVQRAATYFSENILPRHLLPEGMARLQAHLARGDRCVIVTRGFAWCVTPWALKTGVHDVIASHLEIAPEGVLTGRLTEVSCDGEQKRVRLLNLLGDRSQWEVHAYGDSPGDHEMFATADHAFIRRGDEFVPWRPEPIRTKKKTALRA
ncbi:MAG: HAD-IB family hydrolase [Undibacterium sp.]|nr:HAD-IB family hydrolase [Opitutaceae bacterium]